MRIAPAALAALPLLLLGACQVSKDDANGTTSVTYNSDLAENAAADAGNTATGIAGEIGNDLKQTGEKVQNKVDNANLSVSVHNTSADKTADTAQTNKQ